MKITETFVKEIIKEDYPDNYQQIYDNSLLLQYLDKKMKAIHGDSKTRRSLANIYAIYFILFFIIIKMSFITCQIVTGSSTDMIILAFFTFTVDYMAEANFKITP